MVEVRRGESDARVEVVEHTEEDGGCLGCESSDHEDVVDESPEEDNEVVVPEALTDHEHKHVREHDCTGRPHCRSYDLQEKPTL